MIQIGADLAKRYTSFMEQKGVETDQQRYYIKWLRYYLDFCPKYKRQNKESRRYHIHETSLQKALKKAVKKAKIPKRITSHTFRHSFASHLFYYRLITTFGRFKNYWGIAMCEPQ